jgi:hypothetical protein
VELTQNELLNKRIYQLEDEVHGLKNDYINARDEAYLLRQRLRKVLFLCDRVRSGWDALQELMQQKESK